MAITNKVESLRQDKNGERDFLIGLEARIDKARSLDEIKDVLKKIVRYNLLRRF